MARNENKIKGSSEMSCSPPYLHPPHPHLYSDPLGKPLNLYACKSF